MKTISQEEFKKRYGQKALSQFEVPEKKESYFSRIKNKYIESVEDIKEAITRPSESVNKGVSPLEYAKQLGETGLRTVGEVAGLAIAPITEAPGIKEGFEFVGEKLAGTGPMKAYAGWAEKHPEAAKDIEAVLDIAALFGGGKATDVAGKAGRRGLVAAKEVVEEGAGKAVRVGEEALRIGKEAVTPPPPRPLQAVGQVLQGTTKDIRSGVRALKELDTIGIKTFEELATRAGQKIEQLAKGVDDALDNTSPVKLSELKLTGKTAAGKAVSVDYVSRALEQLKEMYTKLGDDIAARNVRDILQRAKKFGLTRKEVNDIARTYGQEFGQKAFGKTGEALTSVNARAFEHVRKALKAVARKGIKGNAAKAMDEAMSDIYRLKDLVKKNVEAVNKLTQKIQERGLMEKVGHAVSKYANVLTGGGLRGIVGGLLPRGVGYKVMNSLDIQAVLERNLKIIQDALKAGDDDLIKLLRDTGEL